MKFTKEEKQQRQDETLRVARILRAWMSRKGIKVKDAAEILKVNPNTISKWCNGSATMSVKACHEILAHVMPEMGEITEEDERTGRAMTALSRYPTIDLRALVLAMSQHIMPAATFAARNSIQTSYFKNGERGVDFGVKMSGMEVHGADYDEHTVMMVRANALINNGDLVIIVYAKPEEIHVARVRREGDELLILPVNGGEILKRLPVFNDKLVGILLVDAIYQDNRSVPMSRWAKNEEFES